MRRWNERDNLPVSWPNIEGVIVGLQKYYNVEVTRIYRSWAEARIDYEAGGGAVLDTFEHMRPFDEIRA